MAIQRISQKDYFTAAGFTLLSAFGVACNGAFMKALLNYGSFQYVFFFRFFVPFLILAFWFFLIQRKKVEVYSWRGHLLRGVFTAGSQFCLLFTLLHSNLLNAILLFSTNGLFLPFLSRIFVGAPLRVKTLFAIVLSFVGIAVVLQGGQGLFSAVAIVGLFGGFFNACSQLCAHQLSRHNSSELMTLSMLFICSVISFLLIPAQSVLFPGVPEFLHVGLPFVGLVLLVAFSVIFLQTTRVKGLRLVNNAATLMPFLYTSIVFSGMIDWSVYHITPKLHVWLGSAMVLLASVIMAFRKQRAEK